MLCCADWDYVVTCPFQQNCQYKLELKKVSDASCEALGVVSKTFSWKFDNNLLANSTGNGSNADSSNVFLCVNASGTYNICLTVTYTYASGDVCSRQVCKDVTIICIAGLQNHAQPYLSPNPTQDYISVLLAEQLKYPCNVVISDMENRVYLSEKIYNADALRRIKLDFLQKGIFIMNITSASNKVYSLKFTKH